MDLPGAKVVLLSRPSLNVRALVQPRIRTLAIVSAKQMVE